MVTGMRVRVKSGPGLGTQGPRAKDSDAWAAEAGGLGPMAAQPHDMNYFCVCLLIRSYINYYISFCMETRFHNSSSFIIFYFAEIRYRVNF